MERTIGLALLLVAALPHQAVAHGACGSKSAPLTAPFLGKWTSDHGFNIEIRPTSWQHRNADAPFDESEFEVGKTFDDLAKEARETDGGGATVSCIRVDAAAVSKLVSDTAASYLGAPKAARLRRALAHPPYRAIMAYYYEAQEYVIILDASHALNVWFGDDSDVDIYDMRRQK